MYARDIVQPILNFIFYNHAVLIISRGGCHPSACSVEPIEPCKTAEPFVSNHMAGLFGRRFDDVGKDHQINKLPVYMCMCTCCIAGNFRGVPFSRIVKLFGFADLIFVVR